MLGCFILNTVSQIILYQVRTGCQENLERRLELMTPIYDERSKAKLAQFLRLQLSDNLLAYELQNDGEYAKVASNEKVIDSQQF